MNLISLQAVFQVSLFMQSRSGHLLTSEDVMSLAETQCSVRSSAWQKTGYLHRRCTCTAEFCLQRVGYPGPASVMGAPPDCTRIMCIATPVHRGVRERESLASPLG